MFARVERTWRQQICPYEVVAGEAVKGVNSMGAERTKPSSYGPSLLGPREVPRATA